MFDRLAEIEQKYMDLADQVNDPEIIANQSQWRKLMKEYSDMTPIVEAYREYEKVKASIAEELELLEDKLELNLVEGVILPNMKTSGEQERCGFLNAEGRCSIHELRPGFCRIFPLGRLYENHSFQYFLQVHECPKEPKSKVKVQKWIDTPDLKRNEKFIIDWHYFLKEITARLREQDGEKYQKMVDLYILKSFYQKPWKKDRDFYEQFDERLAEAKGILKI